MKKFYISDFKNGDSLFGETFAVKNYKRGATRNNKPFIDIELADRTGSVKGKIWSDDMSQCETVAEGDVVVVNATVEDFMGAPQLKISNLSKTEKYDLSELQERTTFDIEEMWGDVEKTIEELKNPHLKKLLKNIFDSEFTERFKKAPAGFYIHHAYLGGLLEHTWEILQTSKNLKKHFKKLNTDMVYSGIILHDLGKALEFEIDSAVTFTTKGKLLGHIYLGAEYVKTKAPEDMPEDLLNEIIHIVLSHHGSIEFGSPVVPKTAEAIAVSVLDQASTRLNLATKYLDSAAGNDLFTAYSKHLGTELYRSPYLDEEINEDIPF